MPRTKAHGRLGSSLEKRPPPLVRRRGQAGWRIRNAAPRGTAMGMERRKVRVSGESMMSRVAPAPSPRHPCAVRASDRGQRTTTTAVRAAVAVPRRRWRQPAPAACTRSVLALRSDRWVGAGSDSWARPRDYRDRRCRRKQEFAKIRKPNYARTGRALVLGSPDARAPASESLSVSLRGACRASGSP